MRIGIDARMMGPDVRGIGRYVERLLSGLAADGREHEYVVFTRPEAAGLVPAGMKTVITGIRWYSLAEQLKLGKIFDREKLDLMLVPHWNAPLRLATPLAITIHDLILWEHPSLRSTTLPAPVYWLKYLFYRYVVAANAKRAKIVFTVSESAKNSILRNLDVAPEKICVTPLGIDPLPAAPAGGPSGRPYVLSVGSGYPHKNLAAFFRAFKLLLSERPELEAVVAGTDPAFAQRLEAEARRILGSAASRVRFAGQVTDAELGALYARADALIFTSKAEGFGLPPLEALVAGAPAVASDIDTSREMLPAAVPLVFPDDAVAFAAECSKIAADPARREAIVVAGRERARAFRWERTAALTIAAVRRTFSTPFSR
jgi:glycosyltransferase involved in cell wall biosynthesis